eukprot:13011583-Alexandrium_andersonii.AAC.1
MPPPNGERLTRPPGSLVPGPRRRREWLEHKTTRACRACPREWVVLFCARRPGLGAGGTWTGRPQAPEYPLRKR